jgi:methylated-DNA-[protein]-cysteine S-methyltransferase
MKRLNHLQNLPNHAVYHKIPSAVGELTLLASDTGLHSILWVCDTSSDDTTFKRFTQDPRHPIIKQTCAQLTEYFRGERKNFDLPLAYQGTDFQMQTWKQLQRIPYGETISYGEQAARLGDKNKARAVGLANGLNPISIVIPCHRVIGKNGKLTGFGGGLENKAYLLQLEKRTS